MKDRDYHIDINEYAPQGNTPQDHPMCRCTPMIKISEKYFTPSTKYLIWEYLEECKGSLIWIN